MGRTKTFMPGASFPDIWGLPWDSPSAKPEGKSLMNWDLGMGSVEPQAGPARCDLWLRVYQRQHLVTKSPLLGGCLFKGPSQTLNQFPGLETIFTKAPGVFSQAKPKNMGGARGQAVGQMCCPQEDRCSPSPLSVSPGGHGASDVSFT